ncbi:sulfite exporter TauE/SafE family protein (plasmid) [Cereibacter azotoformans]|uniref:cytochrome c biogenesis CcdA family protein n=1 Tax=Cereibacter azotoformans TaxID=43057 RepID=UPI001EEC2158|nr:cytochrome c biogenesis protein CcdA [Cereibacter azotoformans]ULB12482.1 sulfite exporter TauE/SafE family protein [Cereibacter azotoformans]
MAGVDLSLLAAALVAGLLSSASPCVLAAVPITVGFVGGKAEDFGSALRLTLAFLTGMIASFVLLGLAAARLGMFFGALSPVWVLAGGAVIALAGVAALLRADGCAVPAASLVERHLRGSGTLGALGIGALTGTVMTPCATPVLATALAVAGTGSALGGSMLTGALMLLAYGIGHSLLLAVAGLAPAQAQGLMRRLGTVERWVPGRRAFSILMIGAGLWLAATAWPALRGS